MSRVYNFADKQAKMSKQSIITLCSLILIMATASCNSQAGKQSPQTYTVATLKGPSAVGMLQYIDSVRTAQNSDLKFEILNEPVQVRKMMIDGTADFAILPMTMAAVLYNKGLDYKLISVPVWGTLYLFGSDTGVHSWEDLRGKRINVMAKGMTPDAMFRYLLEQNGLDPDKDVILDYSFPSHIDLANAVAAGRATLGVISEPYISLAMHNNPDIEIIIDLNSEWEKIEGFPIAQTAFLGKTSLIESNPQLIERVEREYRYSTEWVVNNMDSAAILMVKYGLMQDTLTAKSSIPRANLKYVSAREIIDEIDNYLNIFYNFNPEFIGDTLPNENFYYTK